MNHLYPDYLVRLESPQVCAELIRWLVYAGFTNFLAQNGEDEYFPELITSETEWGENDSHGLFVEALHGRKLYAFVRPTPATAWLTVPGHEACSVPEFYKEMKRQMIIFRWNRND